MSDRKKPNRSGVSLGVNVKAELAEALARYIDATKPKPTKTAVIEMLLEGFLAEEGFWAAESPPEDGPPPRRPRSPRT